MSKAALPGAASRTSEQDNSTIPTPDLTEARRLFDAGMTLVKMHDFTKRPMGSEWNKNPVTHIDDSATGYGLILNTNDLVSIDPDHAEMARAGLKALDFDLDELMEHGVRTASTRPNSGGRATFSGDDYEMLRWLALKVYDGAGKSTTVLELRAHSDNLQDTIPGIVYKDKSGELRTQTYMNNKRLDDAPPVPELFAKFWRMVSNDDDAFREACAKFTQAIIDAGFDASGTRNGGAGSLHNIPPMGSGKKLAFPSKYRRRYNKAAVMTDIFARHGYDYHSRLDRWSRPGAEGAPGIRLIPGKDDLYRSDHAGDPLFGTFDPWAAHVVLDHNGELAAAEAEWMADDEHTRDDGWVIRPFNQEVDPDLSHDCLALELGEAGFNRDARYIHGVGWVGWDDSRWVRDGKGNVIAATRDFLRTKADDLLKWCEKKALTAESEKEAKAFRKYGRDSAKSLRQHNNITSVEALAQSNLILSTVPSQYDADLDLLGTPGGTVNLKTGVRMPAERKQLITKQCGITPAHPGAKAPLWDSFLAQTFGGGGALISFMQRVAGYALTGHTTEQKLIFLFGSGANGKSVFLNVIFAIAGDYAKRAPSQLLLKTHSTQHPTDLAGLQGSRLVVGSELPAGAAWNEPMIKDLTGGEVLTARFMRQDFFQFMPQFTLILAGNHKPSLSGVGEAIRRRVCLVPFENSVPECLRDPDLFKKLMEEAPAIMRWMVDGACEWYKTGLVVPEAVSAASEEYLSAEDTLGEFISDHLEPDPACCVAVKIVYERFQSWQVSEGVKQVWTRKAFSAALSERGIKARKSHDWIFGGYALKPIDYLISAR